MARDPQPTPQQRGTSLTSQLTPGESEFSWGPGLVPPGKELAPPSAGGRYRALCPEMVGRDPADGALARDRRS